MRYFIRREPGVAWEQISGWDYRRHTEYEFDAVPDVLEGYAVAAVYTTPEEHDDARDAAER